jgi:hypothetical protein
MPHESIPNLGKVRAVLLGYRCQHALASADGVTSTRQNGARHWTPRYLCLALNDVLPPFSSNEGLAGLDIELKIRRKIRTTTIRWIISPCFHRMAAAAF